MVSCPYRICLIWPALLMVIASCGKRESLPERSSGFVLVADSRVYYESAGRGEPIIFLHGGFMDGRMWQRQVEAFANTHQVVTVDLRGHGQTVDGDSSYFMYEALQILMDSLGIRTATVVGLSLGAIIATDLALEYPSYVSQLVLVTPGIHGWTKESPGDSLLRRNNELMKEAVVDLKDTVRAAEMFVRSWFDGPRRKPDEVNKEERERALTMAVATIKNHRLQYWTRFADKPATGRLHEIKVPVLVVEGELDNQSIKMNCDTLTSAIAGAHRVMIAGVAHMPNMERAEEFNRILGDFLKGK